MRRTAPLALFLILVASAARAQQGGAALQFNFSNPGARSLGLAGAFAGLADDATAAFANPAGLVQLTRPEVSIEGRLWDFSIPFVEGGRVFGNATGVGLDTSNGLRFAESSAQTSGVSFLSFVYPTGRASLSFFRYQLAKFEVESRTNGFFRSDPFGLLQTVRRDERRQSTVLDVVSWGAAGAYRLTDSVSLGIGLVYSQTKLSIVDEEWDAINETLEGVFGPIPLIPERLENRVTMESEESDWTFNAGLLWQASSQWSLGGFYRQGPRAAATITAFIGPLFEDFFDFPEAQPGTSEVLGETTLRIPDVFGLGFAWHPAEAVTVSFEWDRVRYSQIVEALNPDVMDLEDLVLGDVNEYHVGFEYAFLGLSPIVAVRAGWWHDPAHQIQDRGRDVFDRAIFQGGEDKSHFAFGGGFAFQSFQLDVGIDLSGFVDTVAVSGIYSF